MDFIFTQIVGDGANLFVVIVAIIAGFVAGMSYTDALKTQKEEKSNRPF
ncbi:hypothetical protein WSM22_00180 [Cytophagales bacterium WSM2-2]|nr:hypothetical protein WSM22_00180 [Cytophagales bacterium WSM2-2]